MRPKISVRAITTSGPAPVGRDAKHCASASTSWPSTSATRQPKARHFSASGSSVVTDVTGPSTCELLASMMAHQAIEPPMGGEHGRLPHLAFFHFAVAEEREDIAILAGELRCERKTRSRPTVPAQASRRPDRRAACVRCLSPPAPTVRGRKWRKLRRVEQPGFGGRSIKADDIMAGRQHEAVMADSASRRQTARRKSPPMRAPGRDSQSPGSRPSGSREDESARRDDATRQCPGRIGRSFRRSPGNVAGPAAPRATPQTASIASMAGGRASMSGTIKLASARLRCAGPEGRAGSASGFLQR